MNKTATVRGIYCLALLTLLGDTMLVFRMQSNTADDLIGITSAVLISSLLALLLAIIGKRLQKSHKKVCGAALMLLMSGAALATSLSAVLTLHHFCDFASQIMLRGVSVLIPLISFGGLFIYAGFKGEKLLKKLAALLLVLTLVFFAAIFIFSVQFMSIKYFIPYKSPTVNGCIGAFMSVFPSFFLSALCTVYLTRKHSEKHLSVICFSGGAGVLFLALNLLGIFGSELASAFDYPYLKAVETASLGHIFSRLDGLMYAACFFTCGIKVAVSTAVSVALIRKIVAKIVAKN